LIRLLGAVAVRPYESMSADCAEPQQENAAKAEYEAQEIRNIHIMNPITLPPDCEHRFYLSAFLEDGFYDWIVWIKATTFGTSADE